MTRREAQRNAEKLGLSTWKVTAIAVGEGSSNVTLKCVGFGSIDLALGEAETWDDALDQALRIIFSA